MITLLDAFLGGLLIGLVALEAFYDLYGDKRNRIKLLLKMGYSRKEAEEYLK